ncbi:MAG: DUF3102 domain-containing protein [Oscillospiraceae bacterium]|nr:DUF3102 domain-containing protein [Oscillospiraceae bacterium]
MENKIIDVEPSEVSAAYDEAVKLHHEIITNGTIAAQALWELCRCLKRMRDERLYISLGFSEFEEYCEKKANIKKRQAYNYIKACEELGPKFLQSNAQLGITKLELLTHVPALDRAEFMDNNAVEDMSVSDLKKRIEELEQENGLKGEQISMLQEQVSGKDDTDYKSQVDALTAQVEELKAKADKPGKDIAKVKKELAAKAKEEQEKAVRAAIDKERKAAAEKQQEAIDHATAEMQNQIEGYKKKLESQKASVTEAMQKAAELEKKLSDSRTDNDTKFSILFEQLQVRLEEIFDVLENIAPEKQKKYAGKLCELADTLRDTAEEF